MSSLPPRPKSPPTVDARERDRGRERGETMASRLRAERAERPPPRPTDTYIPSAHKGRRDADGRREYDDRDRDRYRDLDWRDRHHRRDRSPPPYRRRESPTRDRDRRPAYRNAPRRHPSPRRGSFRSRSRSPRRGSPRRYRSRSRSRSLSLRRSPKPLRPRHSTSRSPSGRSPLKRRPSSGSRSPGRPSRLGHGDSDSRVDMAPKALVLPPKEEKAEIHQPKHSPVKVEERDAEIRFHGPIESQSNLASQSAESPDPELKPEPHTDFELQQVESQSTNLEMSAPAKLDFNSPIFQSQLSQSSETDFRTPLEDYPSRPIPRSTRSPPRGPRGYNPTTVGPNQGDSSAQRIPKRRQPYVFQRKDGSYLSVPDFEPLKLPDYRKPMDILEMEKSVSVFRQPGQKLASDIAQRLAQLPKMFYKCELAALDVRIAESRRRICEVHLERAKSGTLGMDYSEDGTEKKT